MNDYMKVIAVLIIAVVVIFLAIAVKAEDAANDVVKWMHGDWIHAPGAPAEYKIGSPIKDAVGRITDINTNVMQIRVKVPLVPGRLDIYGDLKTNRAGDKTIDTQTAITEIGQEIYDRLMSMKSKSGLWLWKLILVEHDALTIIKYPSVSFQDHMEEIFMIINQAICGNGQCTDEEVKKE